MLKLPSTENNWKYLPGYHRQTPSASLALSTLQPMQMLPFPHPFPAKATFQVRKLLLAAAWPILVYVRLGMTPTLSRSVTKIQQCTAGMRAHKISFEFLEPFPKARSAVYSLQSDNSFALYPEMRREGHLYSSMQHSASSVTTVNTLYILRQCVACNVSALAYMDM